MAATFNQVFNNEVVGNLRMVSTIVTLDSSYPTGGYAVTAAQLGLQVVQHAITIPQLVVANGPGSARYAVSTGKLLCYIDSGEINNATSLTGGSVQVTAFGY
jgi:hypothetical protein